MYYFSPKDAFHRNLRPLYGQTKGVFCPKCDNLVEFINGAICPICRQEVKEPMARWKSIMIMLAVIVVCLYLSWQLIMLMFSTS